MTTQTLRNGQSVDIVVPSGQSLGVVAVSGTYNATTIAGVTLGSIASAATGGTYGPYTGGGAEIRLTASATSEIDFEVAVTPDIASDTVALIKTNPLTGGVTGLVGPSGETITLVTGLIVTSVPVGIAQSGTVSAGGAITFANAMPNAYAGGIWLYFPAGAINDNAGAAGFYWCVGSSTTVFSVKSNYVAAMGVPTVPTVTGTAVGSGAGYTGVTSVVTLISKTLPANSIGDNGLLRGTLSAYNNNSAGTKTVRFALDGTNLGGATSTTATEQSQDIAFRNAGVKNRNTLQYRNFAASFGMASSLGLTIDTSADKSLVINATLNTATDYCVVSGVTVEVVFS